MRGQAGGDDDDAVRMGGICSYIAVAAQVGKYLLICKPSVGDQQEERHRR